MKTNHKNKILFYLFCFEVFITIALIAYAIYTVPKVFAFESNGESELSQNILKGAFIIWIIVAVVLCSGKYEENRKRKINYKEKYVKKMLDQTFNKVNYDYTRGIPVTVPKATRMIKIGSGYYSNDFVSGEYKGVEFMQSDIEISNGSGEDKVTIFKGRWLTFEFPKNFLYRMEIVEKGFKANKIPEPIDKKEKKFEKIETESPSFNQRFEVYAEDGLEAFYILDPAFMERIEKTGDEYKGKMMLMFIENTLNVAIWSGKDAFEFDEYKDEEDATEATENIKKEIKLITDFVDFLRLDQKIFKK